MRAGPDHVDIAWREAEPADDPFLRRLYASTRVSELGASGWDTARCQAFVDMQFDLQRRAYRAHRPDSSCHIIQVAATGVPVGRVWLAESGTETRLLDISVLPAWRGRGIGAACLTTLQARAGARRVPLRLHVQTDNPARRLYERLGFVALEVDGLHRAMQWLPPTHSPRIRLQETSHEQA